MTSTEPLAGFEERRLAELKEHIAARAGAKRAHRAWTPRRRLAMAAAATAGACAATVVIFQGGAEPAYAVDKDSRGVVSISVSDFRDAPAVSKRLRELGVPAIVDYVPFNTECKDPRGAYVDDVPEGLYTYLPKEGPGWRMRIDTRLFKPGQTFVWTMTVLPDGGNATQTLLMQGPVAPCVLIPSPWPTW
ncbi:hypothetical protein ACQPZP_41045 [Spirillospora sp. CA-142024]|uniref:hypothetical protein n=1 Tax=Spirillospora sp. CA-142024 TaxID=3240036 RepID=UPI003D8AA3B1